MLDVNFGSIGSFVIDLTYNFTKKGMMINIYGFGLELLLRNDVN